MDNYRLNQENLQQERAQAGFLKGGNGPGRNINKKSNRREIPNIPKRVKNHKTRRECYRKGRMSKQEKILVIESSV